MRTRPTLPAALLAVALLGLVSSPLAADDSGRSKAPDFTLTDLSGKRVSLSALKGRVVVVNFWATWCKPCLQELPYLDAFHKKYGTEGLTVLAVATDGPETAGRIQSVARQKRWKLPVLHDKSGKVVAKLNPRGSNPYTVFIDKQGRVAYRHEGYASGDERKYLGVIKKLLAE